MTAYINDMTQYTDMRRLAETDRQAALREVAQQFEALFLQTMLKSMRDATPKDSMFGDSNARDTYTGMFDQQLALNLSERGGMGLADVLVRQLGGPPAVSAENSATLSRLAAQNTPTIPRSATRPLLTSNHGPAADEAASPAPAIVATDNNAPANWSSAESFVRDIWPHARKAAEALGVAPTAVVAQAALETGWGRHIASNAEGASSLNLFGIKTGSSWNGESVSQPTLEFRHGIAQRETARFRAYDSLEQTFADYTKLLSSTPRYANVHGHGDNVDAFASALQESGYATDPQYAQKISRIANSDAMVRAMRALKL